MEVTKSQSPGCKADIQEVHTVVLEFSPGLLDLYEICNCHDEGEHFLPVILDVSVSSF
jgi:hypothetical protein